MKAVQLREWLLPGRAERDEAFHQEILSLSQRGLLPIAALEIAIGLLAFAGLLPWQTGLAILITGAATAVSARVASLYPYSRLLAAVSSAMAAAITCFSMNRGGADFGAAAIALLLLAPIAVPFRPLDSAAIGAFAAAAGIQSGQVVYIAIVACAAVLAAATLYRQRWNNYSSYLTVLQSSQELQSRLHQLESSKTMDRLSAALAHELSNPIGAAACAIETLLAVSARQAEAAPGDQKRLAGIQTDLLRSLDHSMVRLRKLVGWFHEITNLNETTTQRANLNEILRHAVEAVRADALVSTRFVPLPEILCKPQQLQWVFESVLRNAVQAIEAGGTVTISTSAGESQLEIAVEDTGRGIPADLLAWVFDPMFHEAGGRVSTGNWSLFAARQFIKGHGGEMRIQSQEGRGTTVSVVLPC